MEPRLCCEEKNRRMPHWFNLACLYGVFCLLISCDRGPKKDSTKELFSDAETSFQRHDLEEAKRKSEVGYREYLEKDPKTAGGFRLIQVRVLVDQGLYREALDAIKESPMKVFASCELVVRLHLLEARAYFSLGHYAETDASMRQAEQPCKSEDPMLPADVATARGQVLDDGPVADADFRTALAIAQQHHDAFREAGALLDLSKEALNREHYDQSVEWSLASLHISRPAGYKSYEAKAEGNLAWNYFKLGNFEEAIFLLRQAEQSARLLNAGADQTLWSNELGIVEEQTGQLDDARRDYEAALKAARENQDKDQTTKALDELAFLSIRTSDWENAQKFSESALQSAREDQDHPLELQALFAQGLIASHRGDLKAAQALLTQVANDPNHDRQSLRWEAQAALADLYAKKQNPRAASAQYRVALSTAARARCSIRTEELRLPFAVNTSSVYDRYIDFLVSQGKSLEALKVADESRALTLAEGMGVDGRKCLAAEDNFDPLRVARKADATVLFYWLGGDRSYLWAIGLNRVKLFPLPPKSEIEHEVAEYQAALPGRRDVLETADKHGEYLYTSLVAPAAEFLRKDGRVIVVADGNLSGLGFDSVIVPAPKPHYWIEDVAVENASSLRLLVESSHRQAAAGGKLLLMGDPLPVPEFPALPRAAEELGRVKADFPSTSQQIYERGAATKDSYLASHPEQFTYIHFVAHGTASLTDPLDSAVVLSPSGADGGYKLYARDIATHPLNAELVTIASCTSAGKRIYEGEGLVGISWAFLGAHAHNVIGSLWDVSDSSTSQLMDRLYAELAKGQKPDAALRSAKLAMLHSQTAFQRPNYWAAFQLYTRS
jgi:CHAT domain-containing protein